MYNNINFSIDSILKEKSNNYQEDAYNVFPSFPNLLALEKENKCLDGELLVGAKQMLWAVDAITDIYTR